MTTIKKNLFVLLGLLFIQPVFADPFIPKDDSQVLEKLSSKFSKPISKELKKLHLELLKEPKDKKLVISFAKKCIELSRIESDPRYLGYAEAVIKPWAHTKSPDILIIKATIRQSLHDFKGALEDLSEALELEPDASQAWLTKAQIYNTLGEYENAKINCAHLLVDVNQLASFACLSSVASLNGETDKGYNLLNRIINNSLNANLSIDEKTWALTLLGEIAARKGDNLLAEKHFKEALKQNSQDNYLLTAYSDFLLNIDNPKEVITLLKDKTRIDSLLLRLALAEKKLQLPDFKKHLTDLRNRFIASNLRGDKIHLREEAIFNLKLENNSKRALDLAQKNWTIQKEPLDVQIFLESAIATNNKSAVKAVIDFLQYSKLEDKNIQRLTEEIKSLK